MLPLPGRFDGRDEVDEAQFWLNRFAEELKPFYDDWLPKGLKPRQILELTKIPYITKFSFGEPLPVIMQGVSDPEFPGFYLENVARLLVSDFQDAQIIVSPERAQRSATDFEADISRIAKYAPAELIGRERELKQLNDAWARAQSRERPRPHILTFVALGGEGMTSLVSKWVSDLAAQGWPGCDAAFAWSFYSQGTRDQVAASSDLFLKEALTFFGDAAMASSALGAFDKGRRLAQIVGERRALLILDGLEPLQFAPTSPTPGELKDQGLAALLRGLAATSHGLCIVTTRYAIPDLRAFLGKTVREEKLLRLSKAAGVALLKTLGVKGTLPEFEKLVEDAQGHALTLNLLGSYLRDAHAGDIRRRDVVKFEEADAEEQGGHAFRVMDAYVQAFEHGGQTVEEQAKGRRALALLALLGLFDRPATADCLNALWRGETITGLTEPLIGLSEAQRNLSLTRLETAKLLTINRDEVSGVLVALDAHPLLRAYFAKRLRELQPEAWHAAHRRLYEHLSASTKEGDQPTLEDLQPLYQALIHGCQAGLQQQACDEVYFARIRRGQEDYVSRKLGAFGAELAAVACFFDPPWSRVSPSLTETDQAWLLTTAAFCLRALGRVAEALEPMRVQMRRNVELASWKQAAISASNLSGLEMSLGDLALATRDAEQSVTYADRSGDAYQRIALRAIHADALHQVGSRTEAETRFREAEQMQAESQPAYPLLYSLQGFQYCDLLLAAAERAAWQAVSKSSIATDPSSLTSACRAASQRAAQTLRWTEQSSPSVLDIALDHLTLGRAALYSAILAKTDLRILSPDLSHVDAAVSGLRRAGQREYLSSGLLTRAWLRFLTGARTGPESAQSDLDEAWEIAERRSMKLLLADIHLHRARLFGVQSELQKYPWEGATVDLANARKLVESCGYWRRKEELEDAEDVVLQKPESRSKSKPVTVFISYTHDSEVHRERVLSLAERLRADGIEAQLDRYVNGSPPQGWPRWMLHQLDAADFVLVICTETSYRRFRGHEVISLGRGVDWEGAFITQSIYEARNTKFVPVIFERSDAPYIPDPLIGSSHYVLDSESGYQSLVDFFYSRSSVAPAPLGPPAKRGRGPMSAGLPTALKVWREKLDLLLVEEATSTDPSQKFQLRQLIAEAEEKIRLLAPVDAEL